jgi:phosphate acetyltransferase|tara:strand:- start:2230 stop:3456 length:1227 start_codon:yes stop_codon:yes gene_type:complete
MQMKKSLYQKVIEYINKEIKNGNLASGDSIPSESQLSKLLGVSVGTIRKAVDKLENASVLYRQHGKGTFVSNHRFNNRLLNKLSKKIQQRLPRILLPESSDERVLQAAINSTKKKIAQIFLLGDKAKITQRVTRLNQGLVCELKYIDTKDIQLINIYAEILYRKRKHKGMSLDEAKKLLENDTLFAMLALENGEVDGVVTGAITPSQTVLSNALMTIGLAANSKLVSSFILMIFDAKHQSYASEMIFSDCAMNVDPDADELAEIAKNAYKSAKRYLDIEPKIAMLSFSTNKNTKHIQVKKVSIATSTLKKKLPEADIIGNIQLDAALDNAVLKTKSPDANFIPPANVLVFPNLDSANIGYKLVQRFAGAQAIGPILQGLAKPVNDLSRGCTAEEIVNTVVITANQCDL